MRTTQGSDQMIPFTHVLPGPSHEMETPITPRTSARSRVTRSAKRKRGALAFHDAAFINIHTHTQQ